MLKRGCLANRASIRSEQFSQATSFLPMGNRSRNGFGSMSSKRSGQDGIVERPLPSDCSARAEDMER